jgi:hypothetical protein
MLFLQSITKHADKLNKFAETKTKVRSYFGFDKVMFPCSCATNKYR